MRVGALIKFGVAGILCLAIGAGLAVLLLQRTSGASIPERGVAPASDVSIREQAATLVGRACGMVYDGTPGNPNALLAEAAQMDGGWIDVQEAWTYLDSLVMAPSLGHPEHANYEDALLTMDSACQRAQFIE